MGMKFVQPFSLQIRMLCEKAEKSRNKDFKKFLEYFSRKCSRTKTNMNVLRRLLCFSDLLISS